MPKLTRAEEFDVGPIEFGRLGRFDGGRMSSDAEVTLLGTTDHKLGLIEAAACCIADQHT